MARAPWIAGLALAASVAVFVGFELGTGPSGPEPRAASHASFSPAAGDGHFVSPAAVQAPTRVEPLPSAAPTMAGMVRLTPESAPALFAATPKLAEAMMAHGAHGASPGNAESALPHAAAPNREVAYVNEGAPADPEPAPAPFALAPQGAQGAPNPLMGSVVDELLKQEPDIQVVLGHCDIDGHDVHVMNFTGGRIELLHVRPYAKLSPALEQARAVLLAQSSPHAMAFVYKTKVVVVEGEKQGFEQPLFTSLTPEQFHGRPGIDDDDEAYTYADQIRAQGLGNSRLPAGFRWKP